MRPRRLNAAAALAFVVGCSGKVVSDVSVDPTESDGATADSGGQLEAATDAPAPVQVTTPDSSPSTIPDSAVDAVELDGGESKGHLKLPDGSKPQ